MSPLNVTNADQLDDIVHDAVTEGRRLVLTHQTARGWRAYKARFSGADRDQGRIVVTVPALDPKTDDGLPCSGATLGLTFRVGHKKSMFAARVETIERAGEDVLLSLSWPREMKQVQRRAYTRAVPPHGAVIPVRLWPTQGVESSALEARQVRHAQLEDLSAGGLRIRVANPAEFELGATYRCVFAPRPGKPPIIVDALVRHREAVDGGRGAIGFQFIGLETTVAGRRSLDRIARTVNQFQRARSKLRPAHANAKS